MNGTPGQKVHPNSPLKIQRVFGRLDMRPSGAYPIAEQSPVVVTADDVTFDADLGALREERRGERARLRAPALDGRVRLLGLGRVDADQTHPLGAPAYLDVDRVAIDHMGDHGEAIADRVRIASARKGGGEQGESSDDETHSAVLPAGRPRRPPFTFALQFWWPVPPRLQHERWITAVR